MKNCRTCKKRSPFRTIFSPNVMDCLTDRPPKGRHQPCMDIVARSFGFVKPQFLIAELVATVSG